MFSSAMCLLSGKFSTCILFSLCVPELHLVLLIVEYSLRKIKNLSFAVQTCVSCDRKSSYQTQISRVVLHAKLSKFKLPVWRM